MNFPGGACHRGHDEDGASGWLVGGDDDVALVAELTQALAELASDPPKRPEFGSAEATRARTILSPGAMARATTTV